MTHDDLATLLHDHVSHDEPPAPTPARAITGGRRRLRVRRVTVGATGVAALTLVGAVAVPSLSADSAGEESAMDPASAAALADYDVRRMPALMDEHVRGVLERSVPDLGASTFTAYDSQHRALPERYWDRASSLAVDYGDDRHSWNVDISHARGEAEGDPERYCREGLADGVYLECTVDRTADGEVVISSLWAIRPARGGSSMVVEADELDTVRLDRLAFERRVKVIKSETLITYASETVRATDRDPATAPFATSYDDLAEIGTDPELVMPVPPPGENGCASWSLPVAGESISCGTIAEPTPEDGPAADLSAPTTNSATNPAPSTTGTPGT